MARFTTDEQVAGYWFWEVKSMDEAVQWSRAARIHCQWTLTCFTNTSLTETEQAQTRRRNQ